MKVIKYSLLLLTLLYPFLLCHADEVSEAIGDPSANDEATTSFIDTSKPLSARLQLLLSGFKSNSVFYGLKIKNISHPKKFVGNWTMWSSKHARGDRSFLKADGSCREELYYYKDGKTIHQPCKQWFHIALEKENHSFLLVLYLDHFSLINYEWVDDNNVYFHYYDGGSHLATKASSTDIAKSLEERPILGTWFKNHSNVGVFGKRYNYDSYWIFDTNHKFTLKTYRHGEQFPMYSTRDIMLSAIPDEKDFLLEQKGTWSVTKTKITISVPDIDDPEKNQILSVVRPPKGISIRNFNIRYLDGAIRYSEPLNFSGDPFIGKFQITPGPKSLNIAKKDANHYEVTTYHDSIKSETYLATLKDGHLHTPIDSRTLIIKPVIEGVRMVSRSDFKTLHESNFYTPRRLLRVSKDGSMKKPSLLGNWVIHDPYGNNFHHITFLDNGLYFHRNPAYENKIPIEGTYRKEGNIIYFDQIGGDEVFESMELNEAHLSLNSYGDAFAKIHNSHALAHFWYAIQQFDKGVPGSNK